MIVFSRGEESDIQEVDGRLVDVFVNEQIRKCVVFLYEDVVVDDEGTVERQEIGTGFLVAKSLDDSDLDVQHHMVYPDKYFVYVVTARHVIADSKDTVYIRLNRDMARVRLLQEEVEGTVLDIPTHVDDWLEHPKKDTTDVAVYRLKVPSGQFHLVATPFATLLTKIYTAREGIRAGNEVFSVGLFKGHPGMDKRSEPVIRFGHISLMLPFEKIKIYRSRADKQPTAVEAYLIESRSWGGQSGSPVLIYHPPLERSGSPELMARFQFPLVLGLIHGQYEYDIESEGGKTLVNAGMCIVIPSDKIRETVMQKKFKAERTEMLEKIQHNRPKGAPKPVPSSARSEIEFTQDDFMDALEKSSRKIEPDKEQKQ